MSSLGACFECDAPAEAQHHVIPRSLGGTRTVPLCLRCHGLVHEKDLVTMAALSRAALARRMSEKAVRERAARERERKARIEQHREELVRAKELDEQRRRERREFLNTASEDECRRFLEQEAKAVERVALIRRRRWEV